MELILHSDKDDALAQYVLEGLSNRVLAAEYHITLPDEAMLTEGFDRTRQAMELGGPLTPEAPTMGRTLSAPNPRE